MNLKRNFGNEKLRMNYVINPSTNHLLVHFGVSPCRVERVCDPSVQSTLIILRRSRWIRTCIQVALGTRPGGDFPLVNKVTNHKGN
ncbi:hypothetical protein C0J52_28196 [Blattella germanica]|nr:hypothetical protein C0J52_28196 [Blattella germanica]